jgi:hypothetical protein
MRSGIAAFVLALSLVVFPLGGAGADPAGGGGHGGGHEGRAAGAPIIGGHFRSANSTWASYPGWQRGAQFHQQWTGGHWRRGNYGGRFGWWWTVRPDWHLYPVGVALVPDPYTPPGITPTTGVGATPTRNTTAISALARQAGARPNR